MPWWKSKNKGKRIREDVGARTNLIGTTQKNLKYERGANAYEYFEKTEHVDSKTDSAFHRHDPGRMGYSESELNKIGSERRRYEDGKTICTDEPNPTRSGNYCYPNVGQGPRGEERMSRAVSMYSFTESKTSSCLQVSALLNNLIEENERCKSEIETLRKRPGFSEYTKYIPDHIVKPEDSDDLKKLISERLRMHEELLKEKSESFRSDIFRGLTALEKAGSSEDSSGATKKQTSVQSLCNSLYYMIGGKWRDFGMNLKIPLYVLDRIQPYGSRVDLKGAFVEIIMAWKEYVGVSVEGLLGACVEIGVFPLTDKPMSPTHRDVIHYRSSYVRKNVKLEPLCSYLGDKQVLSVEEIQYIRSTKVMNDQFDRLLDVLPLAGDHVYFAFIDALINTDHDHVATEFAKEEFRLLNCKRHDYVEQFNRERAETRPCLPDIDNRTIGQGMPSSVFEMYS